MHNSIKSFKKIFETCANNILNKIYQLTINNMWLTMNTTHDTLPVNNAYFKIESVKVNDYINSEWVKNYKVEINLNTWKDNTKQVCLRWNPITLEWLKESELNYDSYYSKIKELPEYSTAIDS